ncbi:MAG TPA: vWA domain-containing protein [Cyclobacteriaceae bacterium]|nr:vWA domain-containing protein [Cyclobacteriaceae bacterium]
MQDINEIRPFYIIPGVSVDLDDKDVKLDGIACVDVDDRVKGKPTYNIRINPDKALEIYNQSWIKKDFSQNIPFSMFKAGLLLHEISHIKYEAFKYSPVIHNGLFKTIWNILLDNNGEYSLTSQFPGTTPYIRLILTVLKRDTIISTSKSSNSKNRPPKTPEIIEIDKKVDALFYLARFGVIVKNADENFISFCLPMVLSATRNDSKNVLIASYVIYQYIVSGVSDDTMKAIESSVSLISGMTNADIEKAQNGEQAISNSLSDTLSNLKTSKGNQAGLPSGKINEGQDDNSFYRATVDKYLDVIKNIRTAFKLRLNDIVRANTVEGDMNFMKQMQAYVASFTGEPALAYTVNKRIDSKIDVVVFKDISGSTGGVKVPYAELVVCLLAAISELQGVRSAEIDFSDSHLVNLNFDDKLTGAKLEPRAGGGTDIISGYNTLFNMKWTARKRVVIVITDGVINDYSEYSKIEQALRANFNLEFVKFNIVSSKDYEKGEPMYDSYHNPQEKVIPATIENFHIKVAEFLIGRLN